MLEEFEASGLQQKEFVARHDLSLGTLCFRTWVLMAQ